MPALVMILKIAAAVLLCILAIVLVLLLLLLFAPLRYTVGGSFHDGRPAADAIVKWLGGVLGTKAGYTPEDGLFVYATAFGVKIFDVLEKKRGAEPDGGDGIEMELTPEEKSSLPAPTAVTDTGDVPSAAVGRDDRTAGPETDSAKEQPQTNAEKKAKAPPAGPVQRLRGILESLLRKFYSTIDSVDRKLGDLEERAEAKAAETAERICSLCDSLSDAASDKTDKAARLYELFTDEQYKDDLNMLKKRIIRHFEELRPRDGEGRIRFGSGDPYSTAQVMQAAAFLYPLLGDKIEVIPDFENSIIDAQLDVKGRFRLCVAVEAMIRIFFSKKLKQFYKKARLILELDG